MRYAASSHPGLVRDHNEDAHNASRRLLVVADGVGGAAAGEVASALAIKAFTPVGKSKPSADPVETLESAIADATRALAESVAAHPQQQGMGTTLTALLFTGSDRLDVAHVGDSRAYLWRDGELEQITRDDSYVQELVERGALNPADAATHPYRSVVTKVLQGNPVEPTLLTRQVRTGDRYLVCSDGLSDYVALETITDILRAGAGLEETVNRLIEAALAVGAPDNVTVLLGDAKVTSPGDGLLAMSLAAAGLAGVSAWLSRS